MPTTSRIRPAEVIIRIGDFTLNAIGPKVVERLVRSGFSGPDIAKKLHDLHPDRQQALQKGGHDQQAIVNNLDLSSILSLLVIVDEITANYGHRAQRIRHVAKSLRDKRNEASHQTPVIRPTSDTALQALRDAQYLIETFNKDALNGEELREVSHLLAADRRRSLDKVPRPRFYQRSAAYDAARDTLLARRRLLLHAMGGAGKTSLARELCEDEQIRNACPDGTYWLTASEATSSEQLLRELAEWMGLDVSMETEGSLKSYLSQRLSELSALVVIDDIWKLDKPADLIEAVSSCHLLLTARDRHFAGETGIPTVSIERHSRSQSIELLKAHAPRPLSADDLSIVDALLDRLEDHPLAIQNVATKLRGVQLSAVLRDLESIRDVNDVFSRSIDELTEPARKLLSALREFAQGTPILHSPAVALAMALLGVSQAQAESLLVSLVDVSVLGTATRDGFVQYSVHDLIRQAISKRESSISQELFAAYVLAGYRKRAGTNDYRRIPDDGYLYNNLITLLRAVNADDEVFALFEDERWLQGRRQQLGAVDGVEAYLQDVTLVEDTVKFNSSVDCVRNIGYAAIRSMLETRWSQVPEYFALQYRQGESVARLLSTATHHLWASDRLRLALYLLDEDLTEAEQREVLRFAEQNLPAEVGSWPKMPISPIRSSDDRRLASTTPPIEKRVDHHFVAGLLLDYFPELQAQIIDTVLEQVTHTDSLSDCAYMLFPLLEYLPAEVRDQLDSQTTAELERADQLYDTLISQGPSSLPTWIEIHLALLVERVGPQRTLHWLKVASPVATTLLNPVELQESAGRIFREWIATGLVHLLPSLPEQPRANAIERILQLVGGWVTETVIDWERPDDPKLFRLGVCLLLTPFMDPTALREHVDAVLQTQPDEFTSNLLLLLSHECVALGGYRRRELANWLIETIEPDWDNWLGAVPALVKLASFKPYFLDTMIERFQELDSSTAEFQNRATELLWLVDDRFEFDALFDRLVTSIAEHGSLLYDDSANQMLSAVLRKVTDIQHQRFVSLAAQFEQSKGYFASEMTDYFGDLSNDRVYRPNTYLLCADNVFNLNRFTLPGLDMFLWSIERIRVNAYHPQEYSDDNSYMPGPPWVLFHGAYHLTPDIPEHEAIRLMKWFLRLLDDWNWEPQA